MDGRAHAAMRPPTYVRCATCTRTRLLTTNNLSKLDKRTPRYSVSHLSRVHGLGSRATFASSHNFTRLSSLARRRSETPERRRRSVVVRAETDNGRGHADDEVLAICFGT
eukprot:2837785-Pyramimonas_sp.AAC.1